MRAPPDHLFVYGSLRPASGHPMAARLAQLVTVVGPATVAGLLYDTGRYPALVLGEGGGAVHGELLALPDDAIRRRRLLAELDHYEGSLHGPAAAFSLFHRAATDVRRDDGFVVRAWTYIYARDVHGLRVLPHGDWLARGTA
jgi:gamma-glutamylcyclotransferase (GGCT)/AIG2-like uncharacterized protein YtfP